MNWLMVSSAMNLLGHLYVAFSSARSTYAFWDHFLSWHPSRICWVQNSCVRPTENNSWHKTWSWASICPSSLATVMSHSYAWSGNTVIASARNTEVRRREHAGLQCGERCFGRASGEVIMCLPEGRLSSSMPSRAGRQSPAGRKRLLDILGISILDEEWRPSVWGGMECRMMSSRRWRQVQDRMKPVIGWEGRMDRRKVLERWRRLERRREKQPREHGGRC